MVRSVVNATAPTSMTRSRDASRPVVSRSRDTYSGTGGCRLYVREGPLMKGALTQVGRSADWYISPAMQTGAIEAPRRLEDLHVRRDLVASLLLRTLAFADQLSGGAIETRLGLPFETLQPIIEEYQKAQLMDTMGFSNEPGLEGRPIPVRMSYTVSSAGRVRAAEIDRKSVV